MIATGKPTAIKPTTHPRVFSRLVDGAVERRLEQLDIKRPRWYRRRRHYTNKSIGNLLHRLPDLRIDPRIGIFPSISAEPFFLKSKAEEFVWALVVKVDTSLFFEVPVSDLTSLPMDCRQMYVRALKGPLFDAFGSRILGQIANVAGTEITLADSREDVPQKIDASDVTIEATVDNLYRYMDAAFTSKAQDLRSKVKGLMDEFNSPESKYKNVQRFQGRLTEKGLNPNIAIQPGSTFKFIEPYQPRADSEIFQSRQLPPPRFCFDYAAKNTDTYADRGLTRNGPYSQRTLTKALRVLVIAPAQHKGTTQTFLKKFLGGIAPRTSPNANASTKTPPFPSGFVTKYRTQPLHIEERYFPLQGDPAAAYRECCLQVARVRTEIWLSS